MRQNEKAKKYLLEGSEIGDNPIADKYSLKAVVKAKSASSSSSQGSQEPKEEEKRAKRKRREPKSDSDIMKLDPNCPATQVLVTHDDEYGYTAYNVMMNQTDISTGQNKYP